MPAFPFFIGLGAGTASALLFTAAASGSPAALLLLYVAPLPILLAAVGWRHTAGLIGTVAGAVILAVALGLKTAVYFAACIGLPSWWLAYLALLARPGQDGQPEWYPVGRLVIWCAVIGAGLIALSVPLVATSLADYHAALRSMFEQAFAPRPDGTTPELPGGQDPKEIIDLMVLIAPSVAATFWTLSSIFNLWLAGRITRASGRLARPWPELSLMEFPKTAVFGLLGGVAGLFLPGLFGLVGQLFAGTFTLAFTLLGLAVFHVTTRTAPARGLILFAIYALLVLQPWIAVFLGGLGVAEHLIGIRRRFRTPPPPPPPVARAPLS